MRAPGLDEGMARCARSVPAVGRFASSCRAARLSSGLLRSAETGSRPKRSERNSSRSLREQDLRAEPTGGRSSKLGASHDQVRERREVRPWHGSFGQRALTAGSAERPWLDESALRHRSSPDLRTASAATSAFSRELPVRSTASWLLPSCRNHRGATPSDVDPRHLTTRSPPAARTNV